MEFKKNIMPVEKVAFTRTVVDVSEMEGVYEPALYDYAFRLAYVMYFSDIDTSGFTKEEMNDFVFGNEVLDAMNATPAIGELDRACRECIKLRREEWMVHYRKVTAPDPLDRLVDLIESFANEVKGKVDPDAVMDAVLAGQERRVAAKKKKAGKPRATIKVAQQKKD